MGRPGSPSDVTREDTRRVFAQLEHPSTPITAAEAAEVLECSRRTARRNMDALVERGELRAKEIEGTRVWWRPDEQSDAGVRFDRQFTDFVSAVEEYAIFTLDADGAVTDWNDGAAEITDYAADEIVGEHVSTFYTADDVAVDVPETTLETAAREGRIENEGWRVRADGTRFWAHVTVTAVRDDDGSLRGYTTVVRDLTDRREYERQLRQERDLTERVLETAPVSICVVSADGEFVRVNRRVLDRLGTTEAEFTSYDVDSVDLTDADGRSIPPEERPWRRVVDTGDSIEGFECQADLPGLGRRWLSIDAEPIEDGDGDRRVVIAIDDITDRKEREQRLRREYDQTEKLLRTAPIGIAVQNDDRETIMANQRAQDAFGITEETFLEDPVDSGKWEIYDADDEPLPPDETPSARVLATEEPVFDEELIFEPPTGERQHFRVNAAPLFGPDGEIERVVTTGKEITELKARERQLERRKAELETELSEILDRVSDAFYALDGEWRFTHLNDHAAEIIGRSKSDLIGTRVWDVIPDDAEDLFREQLQTAMVSQKPVTFETNDGNADVWLEYNVYPSESGLSIYFQDITERKEYQRKLEESNERLEQFAYAASHDLQEPLRMVTSYLSLLEGRYGDALDDDAREFIDYAVDGAERMHEMIDGLLAYSRVETRGDPFESVDLDDVLTDTCENLQMQIAENDAEIRAEPLPRVRGDHSQLRQVFQNLLSNAITYSGDEPPVVSVTAERASSMWELTVRDEGIGIAPDARDCIFEVFQRLHSHEEHPGTGIGLALCRRIVERHGGEIRVDSEPGEWTAFSFTLPAADEDVREA